MITLSTAVYITVNVQWPFLAVPWLGLYCVIVLFSNYTLFILEAMTMKIVDSIALFGTYCICYQMYIDLIGMRCVIENKQLIYFAKHKDHKQK